MVYSRELNPEPDLILQNLMASARTNRIPISAQVELTRQCNLNCVHCYIPQNTRCFALTKEEALRIVRELADMGCLFLNFTGGEPLLHPDFSQIYLEAVKLGFSISIFTNASALNAELLMLLSRYRPRKVYVSVYGSNADTYQIVCGSGTAYDSMTSAVRALVRAGIRVEPRMIILTPNVSEFWSVKQWCLEQTGMFAYDFKILPRLDGDNTPLSYRLTPDQVLSLEVADGKGLLWEDLLKQEPGKTAECGGGRFSCFITATGQLQTCVFATVGQPLRDQSVASAWSQLVACTKAVDLQSPCRTCTVSQLCDWCPIWSIREVPGSRPDIPVQYHCDLARLRQRYVHDNEQALGLNAMLVSILRNGYTVTTRASGVGMRPWLQPGDQIRILPVREVRPLRKGDVVCIKMPRHGFAIHRIVEVTHNGRAFKTKGDADLVDNGWVSADRIVGLVERVGNGVS